MGNDNLYMFDIGSKMHTELNLPQGQGSAFYLDWYHISVKRTK